jgi:epoxyqueuosine reductase
MSLNQEEFKTRYRGSPIKRAKWRGYLRNVAIALGNLGSEDAVPVLGAVLGDEEPLVRIHAVWALGQIGGEKAWKSLDYALKNEKDPRVNKEIQRALTGKGNLATDFNQLDKL